MRMATLWVLPLTLFLVLPCAAAELIINDCDDASQWSTGAVAEKTLVKQGTGAVRWDFSVTDTIGTDQIPHDWSSGNTLSFWMYSAKATNSPLWMIISSENDQFDGSDYYMVALKTNYTGWQRFTIPYGEIGTVRQPLGWNKIGSVRFHAAWDRGVKVNPETAVIFDDIKVIQMDSNAKGPRLTDEEFYDQLDLDRPDLAAVKAAVQQKDYKAAGHALAEHIRHRETPKWFINWRDRPVPNPRYGTGPADKLMAHEFMFIDTPYKPTGRIDWSYNAMTKGESATIEWNAQFNRHFHFKPLVDAYWNTGQDKYAKEIADEWVAWIEDCPVLLWQSGNSPYHHAWETLNTAIRLGDTWPNAFYHCLGSPAFTDEVIVTILKSCSETAEHLVKWPSTANWLTSESMGLFVNGTLYPEFKRASEWRRLGVERLYGQLEHEVYPDGLEVELALGYNNWVISEFSQVLKLAKLNNMLDELPKDYLARLECMYNYQLYAMRPDGQVFGFNDSWSSDPTNLLKEAADYFPQRTDFKWAATKGKEGTKPAKDSVAFPYSGHYVLRTGWDPQDLLLHFDAGPWGAGHQHEDKLGFQAYGYGKPLLTEGGVYMYDASRWRRYVLSTRAHNTVRVDDCEQRSSSQRESWVLPYPFKPLDNVWLTNDQWDFVEGSYDFGYGSRDTLTANVQHIRSILFVKPSYWIITDSMQPADSTPHRYEAMFHFTADETTTRDLSVSSSGKEAGVQITPMPLPGVSVQVVKGQEEEPVQGWVNGPWRAVPTALYHWQAAGPTYMTYVVYPTAAGQESPIAAVKSVPVTDDPGQPAKATASEIVFADGSRQFYVYADRDAGTVHFAGYATDARCALVGLDAKGQVTRTIVADGKLLTTR